MKNTIKLKTTKLIKNPNTKTTYLIESEKTETVTKRNHYLATNTDTLKWFRRLGGSESATFSYTCEGYLITRLISTSPDKQNKTIREYKFN